MQNLLKYFKFQNISPLNSVPTTAQTMAYNYLLGLAMIYMAYSILSGLLVYKLVCIGTVIVPAGLFVTPITYCLSNVVTEVYGYPISRNMMWWFIIASAFFSITAFGLIQLPSAPDFKNQTAYNLILGQMPRIFIGGITGTIFGMSFNNYLVSKFKLMMSGKKYWLRSITSTAGGEIIYNIIAYPIMFLSVLSFKQILHIFILVTLFKIIITALILLPECLLARYLKIKENINTFDYNVKYNIFRFEISSLKKSNNLKVIK